MVIPKVVLARLLMLLVSSPLQLFGCMRGLFQGAFFGSVVFVLFASSCEHLCSRDVPEKNVLAGALFSPFLATLLLAVLTTFGSILATLLSAPLSPFLTRFFPRPLALARGAFETDSVAGTKATSPAWVRLAVLRLIGIVPWSGINVACGVLGVGLWDCFLGTFIGAVPWTAVTCQVSAWQPLIKTE
jgi:SNARE associated Golgi protein